MKGAVRPFAALRLFCIARFLARCLFSDLSRLRSDYFLHKVCATPISRASFSVGLHRAKTTELRTTLCNARFLARCMFSDLPVLRSGLSSSLSAVAFRLAYRERHK